jgi:hypothetical protein
VLGLWLDELDVLTITFFLLFLLHKCWEIDVYTIRKCGPRTTIPYGLHFNLCKWSHMCQKGSMFKDHVPSRARRRLHVIERTTYWWKKIQLRSHVNNRYKYHCMGWLPLWNFNMFSACRIKHITLFRATTLFCRIDNIMWNILHIQTEYGEYYVEYCQSRITLLWFWIMLRKLSNTYVRVRCG